MAGAVANLFAVGKPLLEALFRHRARFVDSSRKGNRRFRHTTRYWRAGIFGHESTIDSSASLGRTLLRTSSRQVQTELSAVRSSDSSYEPAFRTVNSEWARYTILSEFPLLTSNASRHNPAVASTTDKVSARCLEIASHSASAVATRSKSVDSIQDAACSITEADSSISSVSAAARIAQPGAPFEKAADAAARSASTPDSSRNASISLIAAALRSKD
jgi:hypothetical protein